MKVKVTIGLYSLPLLEFNNLKGQIAERVASSYIKQRVIPKMRREGWDRTYYRNHLFRPPEKELIIKDLVFDQKVYPSQSFLLRMVILSEILEAHEVIPDGILFKLKTIGVKEPDMTDDVAIAYQIQGDPNPGLLKRAIERVKELSPEGSLLRSSPSGGIVIALKRSDPLPLVDGEPYPVEVKSGRATLLKKQVEVHQALLEMGFKILLIRVRILSLLGNEFLIKIKWLLQ